MSEILDDLRAAKEEMDAPIEDAPETEPVPESAESAPVEPITPRIEKARDEESGQFVKAAKASKKSAKTAAPEGTTGNGAAKPTSAARAYTTGSAVPSGPPAVAAVPVVEPTTEEPLKPPASLTPLEREHFFKSPREIQQAFIRREREFQAGIQEKTTSAKLGQEIQEAVRPFEADMVASGYTPAKALMEWAQLTHTMHRGSPQQKAALAAHLINAMGGDDVIDAINAARQNQPAAQAMQQPQAPPEAQWDAWFQQKLRVAAQQKEQFEWQQALEADEFGADIAQLARSIHQATPGMSKQDAIQAARYAHPQVRQVMIQREARERAQASAQSAQRARIAGSSVKSSPAAISGVHEPESRLELIHQVAAELGRG